MNKKEISWIIIAIILFSFIIGFPNISFLTAIILSTIIILTTTITKKIVAKYYTTEISHTLWTFKRWGFYKRSKLKKPFPIGLVLPFFISLFTLGTVKIPTFLQFNEKPAKTRILKKSGRVRKTEVNESELGIICAWEFYILLLLAIISSLLHQPELATYSIFYGIWNLIPISKLDGSKLFFGSIINWFILAALYIIALIIMLITAFV